MRPPVCSTICLTCSARLVGSITLRSLFLPDDEDRTSAWHDPPATRLSGKEDQCKWWQPRRRPHPRA
jgi:hypothetical protein